MSATLSSPFGGDVAALHDAPGIAFDLDTPDDWSDFLQVRVTTDCLGADGLTPVACAASLG